MFEIATRMKDRFETSKGNLSVEDLWDLPLTSVRSPNLDDIARDLHRQLKDSAEVSFVAPARKENDTLQRKFDIVKHIIEVRLAENTAAAEVRANKEKKARILEIIARKDDEELVGKSRDELIKLAESL
ncbi:MAG: hypothetical protein WC455_24250 [Dehalococcoidia bacterium]|jgi:hypothetical protein